MRLAIPIIVATIVCTAKTTGGSDFIRFDYQSKQPDVKITFDYEPKETETEIKEESSNNEEEVYVPQTAPVVRHRVAPQHDCFLKRFVRRLRRR